MHDLIVMPNIIFRHLASSRLTSNNIHHSLTLNIRSGFSKQGVKYGY